MKTVKFPPVLLALVLLLSVCGLPAQAAQSGMVWLSVADGTDALVMTDTAVADGLITIQYDSTRLTYLGLLAAEDTVEQYAVNAREPGLVKISWVGGSYSVTGDGKLLFRLSFSGTGGEGLAISGQIHDAEGDPIPFGTPDASELEAALADAQLLNPEDYTLQSWEVLEAALEQGRSVLEDPMASTGEMNRAAREILAARENLQRKPPRPDTRDLEAAVERARELDPERYTPQSYGPVADALERALELLDRESFSREDVEAALKALEEALAGLRQRPEDVPVTEPAPGENPETGDSSMPAAALILAAVSGVGCVGAAVCFLRSRGREEDV